MKEMKLTTWERVQLLQCIPPTGRTIEEVGNHLRVAGILGLKEKEKKLVGWLEVQTTQGVTTTWGNDAKVKPDHEFKLTFEDADYTHLINLIGQRKEWPTSQLTLNLHKKLEK